MIDKKLLEKVKCNLCGSDDYKIVYKAKYDREKDVDLKQKFRSSGDETLIDQVVKCRNCGLIYVNPRLKSSLIVEGYSEGSDETFVSQAKGRELTFAKCLKLIEKYKKKGKILDIGTAGGSFLYVAKKAGWDVYGCEPNKWLCDWGKKHYSIDIKPGTVFDQKYPSNHFDVVTLWDVLEHVPDPKSVLEECQRILKKGGILVVNYPDIGSWLAKVMRSKWIFLLSVHLFYFTPKTIRKILDKTGFDTVKIRPHFQKLALGYLMFRMKAYSKLLHKTGSAVTKALRMENQQIPYWLGQTLVIAKKR
ncbi:MAG: class I SAM-dependent methyltransferase [Nanoarchaeota archaeon]|nr:class I SAM-dependent methyltransferase [Nanoarchaeota archaeon]